MSKYDSLNEKIGKLEDYIVKRESSRKNKSEKQKEQLHELFDSMEEKSNHTFSKIQDLGRKATVVLSIGKILPEIPQNFPKNYNIQIIYEDVTMTGNQKFTDFDENVIDEKIILPLLSSESAKFELWAAEEEPSLFDKGNIDLQIPIKQALEKSTFEGQIGLQDNKISVSYTLQVQGIGFAAWLKNLAVYRQINEERKKSRKQGELKRQNTRQKMMEKKLRFAQSFKESERKTMEYDLEEIEKIMQILQE